VPCKFLLLCLQQQFSFPHVLRAVEILPGKSGPVNVIVFFGLDILICNSIRMLAMQAESFELKRHTLGALPVIDVFLRRLKLEETLKRALKRSSYTQAILVLVKSILERPLALYRIREWSQGYASELAYGGSITDDTIARALDSLFSADRASLMTKVVLEAIKEFDVNTEEIHNDSTSVKLYGAYKRQDPKAVQLKRGHSKDHRPDLKQLVYSLTVSADGAIPVHFKDYDGNVTDDTTHWDTWQTLRGMLGKSDFLYVADCKLCVSETLCRIDREQGKFITILPRTRKEHEEFTDEILRSEVRWRKVWSKRSARTRKRTDVFEHAQGLYQTREGFRIHWYRSSEKVLRDAQDREDRLADALGKLSALNERTRRGPKTVAAVTRAIRRILDSYHVKDLLNVSVEVDQVEKFSQTKRGRPAATGEVLYKRSIKEVPRIVIAHNIEGLSRAKATDGIFPLVTNTQVEPLQILKSYKYQPYLEKRHALLKSGLEVAPVFLKKNTRIEALMFVYFIAQLTAALIERAVRKSMQEHDITALKILPEGRPSKSPSAQQILESFRELARSELRQKLKLVQTFYDKLTPMQTQLLKLLNIPQTACR
jgi:transposase